MRGGRSAGRGRRTTARRSSSPRRGWHPGVIGIVAGRLKEKFGRPGDRRRAGRGRHRQGLGPLDLGRRPRRGGAGGEGQRPADRRRRPCDGGGADRRRRRARGARATSSTIGCAPTSPSARRPRPAARRFGRAGRDQRAPLRRARGGRALWRRLAGPARRRRAGAADQGGRGRQRPCPRHRRRRRRQSFNAIAFRIADERAWPGAARRAADQRWWLAGPIKRDEWTGGNAAEMHVEDAALA